MPTFEISLRRKGPAQHAVTRVVADTPEKARARAVALAAGRAKAGDGDSVGDWVADGQPGKTVVDDVKEV